MSNSIKQAIQDFYTSSQTMDFARDFSLRVLSINPGDSAPEISFDSGDLVYIKTASLPARQITNVAVPYMGLPFNVPGNATYPGSDAYELVFYADENSAIREIYENWSRDVFDDATSTGNYFMPRTDSTITLVQVDQQMDPLAQYKLVGVSVRNVGALQYKIAEGTGQTIEFPATVSYHYWTRTATPNTPNTPLTA
jgi:hypothetical protein